MKARHIVLTLPVLFLFLPSSITAQARDASGFRELNHTLTIQPVLLAVPIGVVMYEARLTEPLGVALFGGYGRFDYERDGEQVDATVYGAGMQTRFYFLDRRQTGGNEPHLGVQALWAHGEGEEEDGGFAGVFGDEVWGRGEQFMVGPFAGYKYTAPFGLTLEAQAGMMAGARYSYGGEENSGVDEDATWEFKWLPVANVGVGWSF
ncbi:MAG TPA: hypothetical protein VKZ88_07115 [Fibrobacteria bacterium]|nr:hypothetical protein [Fibrobacteria bacterium]